MKRAFTTLEVAIVLAILGALGIFVVKPSWLPGASKRAQTSTTSTAVLEATTTAKGAEVAASITTIAQANAEAPLSPASAFIAREIPLALSLLPTPDPKALIEAERRKTAVMEGRLDQATKLYETAAAKADRLQKERDDALAARHAADLAIEQAAAADHARTVQMLAIGIVAFLAVAAFIYVKLYSITPATVGEALADIRGGEGPVKAFSSALSPRLHGRVRAARMEATPDEPTKP